MIEINTGGAAFPEVNVRNFEGMLVPHHSPGMTLRDYFAAAALQGSLAGNRHLLTLGERAQEAYLMADAMLRERSGE